MVSGENFGLTGETIEKICGVLSRFPEIESAILYGSRAKGTYKNGSDIDLTLEGKGIDIKLLNRVSLALDELLLPYTFDLSILSHIDNPDLLDHIAKAGKIFYKKAEKVTG